MVGVYTREGTYIYTREAYIPGFSSFIAVLKRF